MRTKTILLRAITLNLLMASLTIAQHYMPKLAEPVSIEDIKVIQHPLNKRDVQVIIKYTPNISVTGNIRSNLPPAFSFANDPGRKTQESRNASFIKNQQRTEHLYLDISDKASGIVHFTIEVPDAPDGYAKEISRWIKLKTKNDTLTVIDPGKADVEKPLVIGEDIRVLQGDEGKEKGISGATTQTSQNYSISISGKIQFYSDAEFTYKGLYKNGVRLWFRNSSSPSTWYHPLIGNIQHKHYDILDEQGNFSFNFSFTGDLSGYNEFIVLVGTSNDAGFTPVSQDGYISYGGSGYTAYYNESEGIEGSISPGQTTITVNQNGEVDPDNGKILRYIQLSKEYLEHVYSNNVPFGMPHIPIRVNNLTNKCGVFSNSWSFISGFSQSIEIDPDCTETSTVSHEYGHWVNYRMWTNNERFTTASLELKEGWAVFFSFGVRNYANDLYGDPLRSWDDNTEEDAFQTGINGSGNPYRYRGMRYPYSGEIGVGALASYMWSVYDDKNSLSKESVPYKGRDNDDIEGYKKRVFDSMRHSAALFAGHDEFISEFRDGLSTEVNTSVDLIQDFMYGSFTQVPSIRAKSVQIKNLNLNEGSSTSTLTWNSSSYSSGNYRNPETGFKVYKKSGGGNWQFLAQLPNTSYSYTVTNPSSATTYKVTSYNSSGESVNAPEVKLLPPAPPTNFTLTNQGGSFPSFTWAPSSGATTYRIYKKCDFGYYGDCTSSYQEEGSTTGTSWTDYFVIQNAPGQEDIYRYAVKAFNAYGGSAYSNQAVVNGQPSVFKEISDAKPTVFSLYENYPNPFNPSTNIKYTLPEAAEVSIRVYNIMGQQVTTLVNTIQESGFHEVSFNASGLSSGLYIARLEAIGKSGQKFLKEIKMQLIK